MLLGSQPLLGNFDIKNLDSPLTGMKLCIYKAVLISVKANIVCTPSPIKHLHKNVTYIFLAMLKNSRSHHQLTPASPWLPSHKHTEMSNILHKKEVLRLISAAVFRDNLINILNIIFRILVKP